MKDSKNAPTTAKPAAVDKEKPTPNAQKQIRQFALMGLVFSLISLFILWFLAILGVACGFRAFTLARDPANKGVKDVERYRTIAIVAIVVGIVSFVGWLFLASR